MKKIFLMLGVTGMVMSSCMNTDVVEEASSIQSGKIAFETHVAKATRADAVPVNGDILTTNLSNFYVAGCYFKPTEGASNIQIFNNVHIQKEGEAWIQRGGQDRYWIAGATYHFFAYSDGNVQMDKVNFLPQTPDWKITQYTVNDNHSKDLIFATTEHECIKETGNPEVGFTFKHLLSKIKFTFTTDIPEENSVTIKNLKIKNVHTTADYENGKWGNWNTPGENDVFNIADKIEGLTKTESQGSVEKFVIPHDYNIANEKIQVSIDMEVVNSEGQTVHAVQNLHTSIGSKWEPGLKYNYNVQIKAEEAGLQKIVFTVNSVEIWEDGTLLEENKNLIFTVNN